MSVVAKASVGGRDASRSLLLALEVPAGDDLVLVATVGTGNRVAEVLHDGTSFWRPLSTVDDTQQMVSMLTRELRPNDLVRSPGYTGGLTLLDYRASDWDEDVRRAVDAFRASASERLRVVDGVLLWRCPEPLLTLTLSRDNFVGVHLPTAMLLPMQKESHHGTLFALRSRIALDELRHSIRAQVPALPDVWLATQELFMDEAEEARRFASGTREWLREELRGSRVGMMPVPFLKAYGDLMRPDAANIGHLAAFFDALGPARRPERRSMHSYVSLHGGDTESLLAAVALARRRIAVQFPMLIPSPPDLADLVIE